MTIFTVIDFLISGNWPFFPAFVQVCRIPKGELRELFEQTYCVSSAVNEVV